GRKDYQQLAVVRRMVRDLLLPVEVVGHATVRDADGLALSSRNAYLSPDERTRALAVPRALASAARPFGAGGRRRGVLRRAALAVLEPAVTRLDYVSVADADELAPFDDAASVPERTLVAIAAYVGTTRLIDNLVLGEEPPPSVNA